ncbi:sigma-70 family RNA polymerase sigma factor [Alicyclobacillaceae bacterium I2511]|nr:sigma-70 family RNA polymerase sigma factor [Alicyclobacillaceae bacterium I2511]
MQAYGADVIHLAYTYVNNYHLAQDIAQDVFLRAFQNMDGFRGEGSVRTWLLAITANRAKDYLRSWAFRHELQDPSPFESLSGTETPEAQVMNQLAKDELWHSVFQLPLKYREVLVLYYLRELSQRDIAAALGITEESVRTRLHRGRQQLRKLLEGGDPL